METPPSSPNPPPRFAAAFLGWLLHDDWHTPLGDFEEYFHQIVADEGLPAARWWYRRQVLHLLPDRLFQKAYWTIVMLKNYFKLAYRTLRKDKVPATINIFGLSIAVACSITVFLFLQNYWTLDTYHAHGDRIFMVEQVVQRDGYTEAWGRVPVPLGPALAADFPQVERAVRIMYGGGLVQHGALAFEEWISFAEVGYFEMFSFPLQAGTPAALANPNAILLSDRMARKYFGDADPVGQELFITFGNQYREGFTVGGVAAPFPANTGYYFDFLINYEKQREVEAAHLGDWQALTRGLFIQLRDPNDAAVVAAEMQRYLPVINATGEADPVLGFQLDNLATPIAQAYRVRDRLAEASHPALSWMFIGIALLMLALSCFNYVNIALGASARRLREIGVRKVMGGNRKQLITQFMTENVLLCALALVVGIAIARVFLLPLFNSLFVLQVRLDFWSNLGFWLFLVALLGFVAVVSGAYPALYVASFQPVTIFQGKQRLTGKRWFTQTFLTVQFTLAFLIVIASTLVWMNGRYLMNVNWGYQPDETLVVRLQTSDQFAKLRDALAQQPHLLNIAGTTSHVGESFQSGVVEVEGEEVGVIQFVVGHQYFEAMQLPLVAGRYFNPDFPTDETSAVIVSEALVERQGWEVPIGQTVRSDSSLLRIVGVVEDVFINPAAGKVPLVFRLDVAQQFGYLTAKVQPGQMDAARAEVAAAWGTLFPEAPFEAFVQEEVFDAFYESYLNVAAGLGYLAGLALMIACMGLFGLAAQNIARRLKEISIRKVVGASVGHILLLINRSFLPLLLIAAGVATLISYGGATLALTLMPDWVTLMPLTPLPFLLANGLVFLIAFLAVSSHLQKLKAANPADVLRNE